LSPSTLFTRFTRVSCSCCRVLKKKFNLKIQRSTDGRKGLKSVKCASRSPPVPGQCNIKRYIARVVISHVDRKRSCSTRIHLYLYYIVHPPGDAGRPNSCYSTTKRVVFKVCERRSLLNVGTYSIHVSNNIVCYTVQTSERVLYDSDKVSRHNILLCTLSGVPNTYRISTYFFEFILNKIFFRKLKIRFQCSHFIHCSHVFVVHFWFFMSFFLF